MGTVIALIGSALASLVAGEAVGFSWDAFKSRKQKQEARKRREQEMEIDKRVSEALAAKKAATKEA